MFRLPSSIISSTGRIGQRAPKVIKTVVKEGPGITTRKGVGSGFMKVTKPSQSPVLNVQAVAGRVAKADSSLQGATLPGVSSIQGQVRKNDRVYDRLLRRRQIVDKVR